MFVALEGIDGSGTTTQCAAIATRLRALGHEVLATAQPSTGPLGAAARSMLASHTPKSPQHASTLALSFAADRLHHHDHCIAPALAKGAIVLCDRYLLSSWAYQGLDLPLEWVQSINQRAPWPDLTLLLDIDAGVAHQRVQQRRGTKEIYDQLELQERLAQSYRKHAREHAARGIECFDATLSIDDLCQALLERILARRSELGA